MAEVRLFHGDCLDILPTLPDKSVDAIITDLPYGTTACKWDVIIPLDEMWKQVKRICRGAFVTTASQPFTSVLVASNLQWFKYEWIWEKDRPTGAALAKIRPMRAHENIVVFSQNGHTYNPQKTIGEKPVNNPGRNAKPPESSPYSMVGKGGSLARNPRTVQKVNVPNHGEMGQHPTQKPVALYEYLIRTYTNEGDTVLDFCMGSGTTGCAAVRTNRNFIGMEMLPVKQDDPDYFGIASRRISEAQQIVMEL